MTLSERLEAARRARLEAVGRLTNPPPRRREANSEAQAAGDTPEKREAPQTSVEVPPTNIHLVPDRPVLNETGRCPSCGFEARIDIVDLVGHTTHFSCTNCGTLWQVRGLHTVTR